MAFTAILTNIEDFSTKVACSANAKDGIYLDLTLRLGVAEIYLLVYQTPLLGLDSLSRPLT